MQRLPRRSGFEDRHPTSGEVSMKKYRLFVVLALIAVIIGSCGRKASESSQTSAAGRRPPKVDGEDQHAAGQGLDDRAHQPPSRSRREAGRCAGRGALGVSGDSQCRRMVRDGRHRQQRDPGEGRLHVGRDQQGDVRLHPRSGHARRRSPWRTKGLLVAQFGEGNTANRPLGSGFWAYATSRDTTSYREVEGTLYGCRFDKYRRGDRVRARHVVPRQQRLR